MVDYSLKKVDRIRNSQHYSLIYKKHEKRLFYPTITVFIKKNGLMFPRLGITVSKRRVSKKAIHRNQVKRCIKDHFRTKKSHLASFDIVVHCNENSLNIKELRKDLEGLCSEIKSNTG